LIFAGTPIAGPITDNRDNLPLAVSDAPSYVTAPSLVLGQMDFYPLAGKCEGAPSDASKFAKDVDYDRDFNGTSRGTFTFRGAYAGSGKNPGWPLGSGIKSVGAEPDGGPSGAGGATGSSGGAGGATGSTGGVNDAGPSGSGGRSGTGAGASANAGHAGTAAQDAGVTTGSGGASTRTDGGSSAATAAGDSGGCGCRIPHGAPRSAPFATGLALALLGLFVRGRRRRVRGE